MEQTNHIRIDHDHPFFPFLTEVYLNGVKQEKVLAIEVTAIGRECTGGVIREDGYSMGTIYIPLPETPQTFKDAMIKRRAEDAEFRQRIEGRS